MACLCAFLFVGHLAGVREGTFVCAAFTGVIVNIYMGLYGKLRDAPAPDRRHAEKALPIRSFNEAASPARSELRLG